MKKGFYFIRHGESESNAGEKTQNPQSINLTPKGRDEAKDAAAAFPVTPDLVITSRYVRTQQTAAPFLERFGALPEAEWNIHEFTYLSADKYKDTTNAERRPFLEDYWQRADPFYKDDDTAESFAEFAGRCRETVEQMKKCEDGVTVAFSHGYFMNGILFHLAGGFDNLNAQAMRNFWEFHGNHKIDNCAVLKFDVDGDTVTLCRNRPPPRPKKSPGPFLD